MAFPGFKGAVIVLVLLNLVSMLPLSCNALMAAPSSGEGIITITTAASRPANQVSKNLILLHEPVLYKSQEHQYFSRILGADPEVFKPVALDKSESGVRQGITVYALTRARCGLEEVCLCQKQFISMCRAPAYEDSDYDVWIHLIFVQMPLTDLVRLELGSTLKVGESNSHTIWLTTATDSAYLQEHGGVMANPDLFYKNATLAVDGTNVVFNIADILKVETEAPANLRGRLGEGLPDIFHILSTEIPTWLNVSEAHDGEHEDEHDEL